MPLIFEDGTGLPNADTYVDIADMTMVIPAETRDGATTYFGKHGSPVEWTSASTAAQESALRYASLWLDGQFRWIGLLSKQTQFLGWPRILGYAYVDTFDEEGRLLTGVPIKIQAATCEAALAHLKTSPLNLVQAPNSIVRSVRAGSVAVDYNIDMPQATYRYIMGLLRGMYAYGGLGGTKIVKVTRL